MVSNLGGRKLGLGIQTDESSTGMSLFPMNFDTDTDRSCIKGFQWKCPNNYCLPG
jgi:hypothetical protein